MAERNSARVSSSPRRRGSSGLQLAEAKTLDSCFCGNDEQAQKPPPTRLGDVANFRNGLNFTKGDRGAGCPYVGIPDFSTQGALDYSRLAQINAEEVASPEDYLCNGDIVFVRSNGNKELVGRSVYIQSDLPALFSGFCIRARLDAERAWPLFVYYFSKSSDFRKQLSGTGGSNINNLNQTVLGDVRLPKQSLAEQKKIAAVLSALDAKIDLNNRINAELEALAKTIYDYWFVQFDFPDAHDRPYKSSGGAMIWNDTLKREIPAGWEVGSLWDIATYTNGLAMQKFRPKGADFLPVIKIKEMSEGFSSDTERARPTIADRFIVNDGDILFSWSATLAVQIWTRGRGALNQHIFKVTSEKYPASFVYFQLTGYLNHFKMMAEKRKTTMGHITLDHLRQSFIVTPPVALAEMCDESLQPILDQYVALNKENQKLAEIRDWLLPLLMNGQVHVRKTPRDEQEDHRDLNGAADRLPDTVVA